MDGEKNEKNHVVEMGEDRWPKIAWCYRSTGRRVKKKD
jgi:hypothetical protein